MLPIGPLEKTRSRLPVVTIALIALNAALFVITWNSVHHDRESPTLETIQSHILLLKARVPDVNAPAPVQQIIDDYRKASPTEWAALMDPDRTAADDWEAEYIFSPQAQKPEILQVEMDLLCRDYLSLQSHSKSFLSQYAFRSYQPSLESYFSYQFLNRSWLHLHFNLYILWLCGSILEDRWTSFAILPLYLASGILGALLHLWISPNSLLPILGSSASIAGLMTAASVRFPDAHVVFRYPRFNPFRADHFTLPLFFIAPVWFVLEIFFALGETGVAHFSFLGGALFGAVIGGIAYYNLPRKTSLAPAAAPPPPDDALIKAAARLERFDPEGSIAEVRAYLSRKPDSMDAWQLLLRAQDNIQDYVNLRDQTIPNIVRLCFAAGHPNDALRYIERYRNLGGKLLEPTLWLDLCRKYEHQHYWESAVNEYTQLGYFYYHVDKVAIVALINAARISLTQLRRPAQATFLYRTAAACPIPHLDLAPLIDMGLQECASSPYMSARITAP